MAGLVVKTSEIGFDPQSFFGYASNMPHFDRNPISGELWFNTTPGTVDRCFRILLPGMADLIGSRGCVNRHGQQRRAPDGYQSVRLSGFSPVRQPDPDFQHLCMVSILRDLTHEDNSTREFSPTGESDGQSKA